MFGKWFTDAYTGSMMGAGPVVFSVWPWVCAHAGATGELEINPRLVAAHIGATVDEVRDALEYLQQPDPESRSEALEGRRLVHVQAFTYQIVNHEHWRGKRSADERREYNRQKQREHRERKRKSVIDSQDLSVDVKDGEPTSAAVSPRQKTEDRSQKTEDQPSPKARKRPAKPPTPEGVQIAQYLYDAIESHSPSHLGAMTPADIEKRLTAWAKEIDGALACRGTVRLKRNGPRVPPVPVTLEDLRTIIDYAHHADDPGGDGSFSWHDNLRSGASLREQAGRGMLIVKARRWASGSRGSARGATVPDFDYTGARDRLDAALAGKGNK